MLLNVLKRLVLSLRSYWRTLLLIVVILFAQAGVELLPPLFQKQIVDGVIEGGDLSQLGWLLGGMVLIYAVLRGINVADLYLRHALGEKFIYALRVRLYD